MAGLPHGFFLERERQRNTSTRVGYQAYAQHRAQQMALVQGLKGERIAILGAGNCNDLELSTLAEVFQELHLFDIDAQALAGAFERQSGAVQRACYLHAHDLTGVASFLEEWRSNPPQPLAAQVAAWGKLAPLLSAAGQFDAVISTCLLSQVAINLRDFFGLVPALNTALLAAVTGHVALASSLTKAGGTLLVVSDCITSQYPIHQEAQARGAVNAIFHLAAQGAVFPGTDPALIADLLRGPDFSAPELKRAWIWDLNEQSYLVYAIETVRQ